MNQQFSSDNIMTALSGGWSQADRVLRLTTPLDKQGQSPVLLAEALRGIEGFELYEEGLHDAFGFRLEVTALSTNANLELKQLISQPVLLQLQTSQSRTELRPFHGHVTQFEHLGSNGGLARYRLTIEPWTVFLRYRRDSTVYQDMTVIEIIESVFSDYRGQGKLNPAWRVDLADVNAYPKRSLTTQYQETDLAFIERLMAEEGLFVWFEHSGDTNNADFGMHTLVIADHNEAFKPNEQSQVRYTQPGVVMKEDSIDRWRSIRRWQTNAVELVSWNYRENNVRPVAVHGAAMNSSDQTPLVSQDVPGVYAYETREQGQRIATNQLQAIEAYNKRFTGAGTVRTLRPGTVFTLNDHADHDQEESEESRTFAVLRVVHLAHNNLGADMHATINQALGEVSSSFFSDSIQQKDSSALGENDTAAIDKAVYRNRINAIRKNIPYRPSQRDGQGALIHPKPTVHGQQTAIVVGASGDVIHTDRDHRIKVQFHWQRGAQSHSRLQHPSTDGHTGAPADDSAGTWVRVATPLAPVAGTNWGSQALPRVGQEVLIDYLEGDIDRPVVIGSLYNGQGQENAQGNGVSQGPGSATGNAAAWFPGHEDAHNHPAVLSGIKTQAMGASQQGVGAYNQLVFDDTPGQSRTALQQHAGPHQGTAELNLGHIRHQTDNQRLPTVGYGAEFKTPHSVAIRAGQGLLLSTDTRNNATSSQLDSKEAQTQIEQSHTLQKTLAETAQKHNAKLKAEPAADKLPAIDQHQHSLDVVMQTASGGESGNQVTAYSEPHLQFSSPAGITAMTPASAILAAGNTSSITANQDINLASQKNSSHAVKNGISLFTYGKASDSTKPNQETGIKLHAASGTLSSQSQSDETKITADKLITVASITRQINITAKQHVQLTAQGAYLKLEGGNIEIHGPGVMAFKASMKELTGPQSKNVALPSFPKSEMQFTSAHDVPLFSQQLDLSHLSNNDELGFISAGKSYQVFKEDGTFLARGVTDEFGITDRFFANEAGPIKVAIENGSWQVEERHEEDDDTSGEDML